jgi:hypothetical protein
VQTPHKVSAVCKSGACAVVAANGKTKVAARSDEMLAASGEKWGVLAAGTVKEYGPGVVLGEHGFLPAPEARLSAPIALRLGSTASSVTASASQVSGAEGYEFSVWRVAAKPELVRRARTRDSGVVLGEMEPGSYHVRARAFDAAGLEGLDSAPVPLRVVEAEPPQGAMFIDGGIRLPASQRVRLLGIEGVEVSYGAGAHFVPAPSAIGLFRGGPTLVRLRPQGQSQELALFLTPRILHADVQIGPARARWPGDEITVKVRLTDGHGRPLGEDERIDTKVSVNLTPVEIDWKRDQNTLSGVVPRPAEAGPWVVRVEVTDDCGTTLAHDFLEVAASAPPPAKR